MGILLVNLGIAEGSTVDLTIVPADSKIPTYDPIKN